MAAIHATLRKVGVNMGDHAETVDRAVDVDPSWTLQQVVDRLLTDRVTSYPDDFKAGPRHEDRARGDWALILRLAEPVHLDRDDDKGTF